ncbi:MAG TPA: PHP domain-containing protein [Vicinamibacterales bacterium]|nr:PHP domain-containing protein [Vicinamibacterales bacterium]
MDSTAVSSDRSPRRFDDVNAVAAGFLRDLAYAQASGPRMFGYKRAAASILALEQPLTSLVLPGRRVAKIPGIGPASERVILEVLDSGSSPTVERAVAQSDRSADVTRRRGLRSHFLSRAEVLRILRDPGFGGPAMPDYQGDLQMHSEWSDGAPTLAEIVEGCLDRGYHYAAVTDHSHGLKIAGGMSMAEAAAQGEAIARLNADYQGRFRLLRGIEANIGADGRLDLSAGEAASFELVLAAAHSKLRRSEDQTARMLAAVEAPHVHVLAHPRGRISSSRAGIVADWDAVFAAAASHGVAIEIDGDPSRQDLDFTLAERALAAGCLFALDSDAHAISQLRYAETAIAHARLAGIPPQRIVNCWPPERLLEWLRRKTV